MIILYFCVHSKNKLTVNMLLELAWLSVLYTHFSTYGIFDFSSTEAVIWELPKS